MPGSTDPAYQAALAWVNLMRARLSGLGPLPVLPRAEGCREPWDVAVPGLIAVRSDGAWARHTIGRQLLVVPSPVREFVVRYRSGGVPDLLPVEGVPCGADLHHFSCRDSATSRVGQR